MNRGNGSQPTRIGLIGAGRIVERAHLPALAAIAGTELVGIFDPDFNRARQLADRFSISAVCTSSKALFDLRPDVTLIACPNRLHAELSIAALKAGSHVLCEKPMAIAVTEAEEMIRASETAGRELMIGSTNRFRPEIVALRQAIEEDRLGQVQAIRCGWRRQRGVPGLGTWFTSRSQAGGGVLIDLGSHLLDIAIWLGGCRHLQLAQCVVDYNFDPVDQAAWYVPAPTDAADGMDVEISASGFAVFDGPLDLFIEVSWASAIPADQTYLAVQGKRGSARLDTLFGLSPNGIRPERPLLLWTENSESAEAIAGVSDLLQPYRDQWRFFLDSIATRRSLRSACEEGLLMTRVIQAMYRSAEEMNGKQLPTGG